MADFSRLLADAIRDWGGSKQDFARELGITPSRLSHLLVPGNTPGTEVCVDLSGLSGISFARVMRAAGKSVLLEKLEKLLGEARDRQEEVRASRRGFTPWERKAIEDLRAMSERDRRMALVILDRWRRFSDEEVRRTTERTNSA